VKRAPRAVLDTNVVLSALVFGHEPASRLREAWQTGHCAPLVSKATASELVRVLTYPKFKLSTEEQHELFADYLPHCLTVTIPAKVPRTPRCRHPFDVPFLQLAVTGKAHYIVTGDQDLLEIKSRLLCPIVTLKAFLGALPGAQGS
jgi:putative PIN family toxin of toxin-antitoxin system